MFFFVCFFFFKQKTAYEMAQCDWSSDVCSSDLPALRIVGQLERGPEVDLAEAGRSEERRVGKECIEPCRSRWSPYHLKKKKKSRSITSAGRCRRSRRSKVTG